MILQLGKLEAVPGCFFCGTVSPDWTPRTTCSDFLEISYLEISSQPIREASNSIETSGSLWVRLLLFHTPHLSRALARFIWSSLSNKGPEEITCAGNSSFLVGVTLLLLWTGDIFRKTAGSCLSFFTFDLEGAVSWSQIEWSYSGILFHVSVSLLTSLGVL